MLKEAQVVGPHETIEAQIQRRQGVAPAEIDNILLRLAYFVS